MLRSSLILVVLLASCAQPVIDVRPDIVGVERSVLLQKWNDNSEYSKMSASGYVTDFRTTNDGIQNVYYEWWKFYRYILWEGDPIMVRWYQLELYSDDQIEWKIQCHYISHVTSIDRYTP